MEPDQIADEHARVVRSMIEHENNLINYRITWLVTLQGLLMAGLGFAWDKQDARNLVGIFCGMGALVAFSCWLELRLSSKAFIDLFKWWDPHSVGYSGPPVIGHRAEKKSLRGLLRAHRLLPWIFIVGWLLVFIHNYTRGAKLTAGCC